MPSAINSLQYALSNFAILLETKLEIKFHLLNTENIIHITLICDDIWSRYVDFAQIEQCRVIQNI